jgi:small subunit ribosomal protein S17
MSDETTTPDSDQPDLAEAPEAPEAEAAGTEVDEAEVDEAEAGLVRGARKVRDGVVVSDKMDKTVVVLVERRVKHPKYHKTVTKSKRYKAHDEANDAKVGDRVRIVETRPLSKTKRFRVQSVLERAK